jgi:hypothetical protein
LWFLIFLYHYYRVSYTVHTAEEDIWMYESSSAGGLVHNDELITICIITIR